MDCGPPGFTVHGILQARTLKWVAVDSSRASSQNGDQTDVSYISGIGRQFFTMSATWEALCTIYYSLILFPKEKKIRTYLIQGKTCKVVLGFF